MATNKDFIDYVIEQAQLGSRIACRKMFGEYGLYVDGKVVAFACDNSLFLKPTSASERLVPDAPQKPPYPGAKNYPVIDELLDDSDALKHLLLATADVLPVPTPKPAKKIKKRSG